MSKKILISFFSLVLVGAQAQAQEKTKTLPSVVVTAAKEKGSKTDGYKTNSSSSSMRTDTPLLDTPQSVSVVTGEQIRDQNITKMEEAARYVPGVNVQMGEGHRDQVTIRGMTNGNNGTTSNFFIDGARDDAEYVRDFYNIENIEFLKGPNAMAFGRGSPGGAINRISKTADGTKKSRLVLSGGSFNDRRIEGDVGGKVNEKFAVRLNTMYQKSDSYRDYAGFERYGFNPTATIKASEDTKIQVGYEHFDDSRTLDRGIPAQNGAPYKTNYSTVFGNPDYNTAHARIDSVYGTITHDFDTSLQLKNTTRYTKNDKFYNSVVPGSISGNNLTLSSAYQVNEDRNNFTNQTDLTKKFETGSVKHTALFGTEVTRQDNSRVRASGKFSGSGTTTTTVSLSSPISYESVDFNTITDDNRSKVDVLAAYFQDQAEINEYIQLTGGIRVDRFEIDLKDRKNNANYSRGDTMYSPRAGLVIKPQKSLSLYSSYGVTYQPSSGDQISTVTLGNSATSTLRPEKFTSYEVGAKWDVTPRINLSTAIFQLERTNTPAADPSGSGYSVQTGESRTKGFEFAATGKVTDSWQAIASYAFQDAEITKKTRSYNPGTKVALVPHNTFALWNKYDLTKSFAAALGVISQSDQYADANNSVRLKGFTRFDAALYYKVNASYRVQLNVENLLDRGYHQTAHSATNIQPGSPRAFKAALIADF
jgi:catecholate siderophore receptor